MTEEDRLKAKALLLKARIYRLCGFLFALSGLAMFIMMFMNSSGGRISLVMKDPMLVVIIVFPFIPAMILNRLAHKADHDFAAALEHWKNVTGKNQAPK